MILKNKFLTASLLLFVSVLLMMSCSDGPTSTDTDEDIDEKVTDQPINELPGDDEESIVNATYDLSAPSESTEEEISTIEQEGVQQRILRTEIEIAVDPNATSGQVNDILKKFDAKIVDMLEGLPFLIIQIEDPGDENELEEFIQQLESEEIIEYVLKSLIIEEPLGYQENKEPEKKQKIPNFISDISRIDHHLAIRSHGTWNMMETIQESESNIWLVIADLFGDGTPRDGYNANFKTSDFTSGSPHYHGYHVLGIVAGMYDESNGLNRDLNEVVGGFSGTLNVRAVDLMNSDSWFHNSWLRKMNKIIRTIRDVIDDENDARIILNTSLNSRGTFFDTEQYAFVWIKKVRGLIFRESLESKFIHFTSAGNVGKDRIRYPAKENSMFAFAGLENPSYLGISLEKLTNTFVVENRVNTLQKKSTRPLPGCASTSSIMGGNISAMGTDVYSFGGCSQFDSDRNCTKAYSTTKASNLSGTSMSTPQAASVAANIWGINPDLSVSEVIEIIKETADDLKDNTTSSPGNTCNNVFPQPVVDSYAATLAAGGDFARLTLLDVNEDGTFDEDDIEIFLNEYEDRDSDLDYSRYDLNASGQTGGNATERFDLNDDIRFGKESKSIQGEDIEFNENELTDSEILCYYAYSDLFEGNPDERNNLLDGVCYKAENISPTVEITSGPSDGETVDYTNPQFEWQGSDEDGNVEEFKVELNGPVSEDFTTADNNYQFEGLSNGDYTFRVRAIDNEGAQSAWEFREFTVAVETENQPPTVEITGGPSDGETIEYTDPEFEWQGSDEDGSIDEYSVELNGPDSEEFTTNNTGHQFQDLAYGNYEFRVRAIDNEGAKSAWASREFTVEKSATSPVVTTLEVSSITATSAESGGDVTDNGGDEVSVRGVCWSTSETPDVDDDCTNNGGGEGEFSSLIEDLVSDTKYYVRAYAVNKEGIGYGDVLSFRTDEEDNKSPTVEITGGPSDGETIDHTNPEFEWEGSDEDGNIEEYRVELDGPDSEEFTTDDTDHQFEDLSYGDYEFRIRAIDNEGAKSTWASREFTVQRSATRPTVTTLEVSSITTTSAQSGGDVTDNGGDEVSVRGVCWSTSETPDFDDDCTNNGGGTGEFTSSLEDLSPDTEYYVRAYAVNEMGIGYGDILSFRTNEEGNQPPTVEITAGPNDGETIDDTDPEFEWDGSDEDGNVEEYNVELNGPDSEEFTTDDTDYQFEDLASGDYEFRVRAVDNDGANSNWASREFTIEQDVTRPTVTTSEVSSITTTSAQSGGNVTDNGGDEVSVRGVCWSTSETPEFDDDCTNEGGGTGEFTSSLEDLSPDTKYYVRAYAVNIEGIGYGDILSFRTDEEENQPPTVEITGGPSDGETIDYTNPEFEWSGSDDGSVEEYNVELNGPDSEGFTTNDTAYQFEGLSYGDYEFRVRAVDNDGANSEWESREFTIEQDVARPTVTTSEISSITTNSAESGGDVTDDGGDEVSVRGVCWSTSQDPDVNDDCTNDGGGDGEFTSLLEDLMPDTKYYVRAYAVNIEGIGYGEQKSFTTESESNDDWPRDTETEVVDVTNPETGRTWMDRNLGASRAATSSTDEQAYGDLYQWGRPADGHQKRNSGTTTTLSTSDQPGHDDFIIGSQDTNWDWRAPRNDNLWQWGNGTNNPCPSGFRLPTAAEWEAESNSWSSNNATGAFASPLKLPQPGYRGSNNGSLYTVGSNGRYWSSSVDGTNAGYLYFSSSKATFDSYNRAYGHSVRCIKN